MRKSIILNKIQLLKMGEYSLLEKRYLLWGLLCLLIRVGKSVEDRVYRWEVKYEYKSPDCFKKMVISINGMTPGPQINAKQGDTIIVEVTNRLLTENIAIHWHGIRQVNLQKLYFGHFYLFYDSF